MNNLFQYAKKELSQDAVLMWLIDNWNCNDNDVKNASLRLLREFGILGEIRSVVVKSQWHKIDIRVDIKTDVCNYYLGIEDKVLSGEHEQLERYSESLKKEAKQNGYKIINIFYKTSLFTKNDDDACSVNNWEKWDIFRIADFFKQYENSDNLILRQYAVHLNMLSEGYKNTSICEKDETIYDTACWIGYFTNVIRAKVRDHYPESNLIINIELGHYGYVYIQFVRADKLRNIRTINIPYMEFRSRDFKGGKTIMRFLCYGMEYNNETEDWISNAKLRAKSEGFILDGVRTSHPKQIGKVEISYMTTDLFIEKTVETLDKYYSLMESWGV